ncbi:hypothetical protein FQR65_LT18253 [Abscondita terminalis]|nr:hypothetical protein FQR65_LT18253 [Abscondita terminalis]
MNIFFVDVEAATVIDRGDIEHENVPPSGRDNGSQLPSVINTLGETDWGDYTSKMISSPPSKPIQVAKKRKVTGSMTNAKWCNVADCKLKIATLKENLLKEERRQKQELHEFIKKNLMDEHQQKMRHREEEHLLKLKLMQDEHEQKIKFYHIPRVPDKIKEKELPQDRPFNISRVPDESKEQELPENLPKVITPPPNQLRHEEVNPFCPPQIEFRRSERNRRPPAHLRDYKTWTFSFIHSLINYPTIWYYESMTFILEHAKPKDAIYGSISGSIDCGSQIATTSATYSENVINEVNDTSESEVYTLE